LIGREADVVLSGTQLPGTVAVFHGVLRQAHDIAHPAFRQVRGGESLMVTVGEGDDAGFIIIDQAHFDEARWFDHENEDEPEPSLVIYTHTGVVMQIDPNVALHADD
jgi:hypothetical protein